MLALWILVAAQLAPITSLDVSQPSPVAGPFDPRQAEALNRRFCAEKWPNDFAMQDFCFRNAVEGMSQFVAASRAIGRPLDKALEKCVETWTKSGVPDFAMIGYCATEQADAYRKVHPGG